MGNMAQSVAIVLISQSSASALSEQQVEKNCKAFLYCENEMMSIHKRCTQHSRQMTTQLCHLNQEFKNLSELMNRRVDEFRRCVLDKNLDLQVDEDVEEQCGTVAQFPVPDPKLGCWQAVQTVRLHCQQLQKCCPNANTCLKQLKDSELTKSVREKHIEINRKTLKCRAQVQEKMVKRRNSTDALQSDSEKEPVVTNGVRTPLPGSNAKGIYAAPRANVFLSGVIAPPQLAFQSNDVAPSLQNEPANDIFDSFLPANQQYPAVRIRQLKHFRLNPQPINVDADIVDITREAKESLPDNRDSIPSNMNNEPKSTEGGELEPLPAPAQAFRLFMSSVKPPTTDESEALSFTTILAKSFSEATTETPPHSFLPKSTAMVEDKNVSPTPSSIKSDVVSTNTNVSATRFVVPQYASTLRPIRLRKIQKISTRVPTSEYIYKAALLRQKTRDLRHQRMRELARLYASSVPQSRQVKVVDESGGSFARKNKVINLTFVSDSIPQRVVFPEKLNAAKTVPLSPIIEPEFKAIKAVLGKPEAAKLTPRFTIQPQHRPITTTTEEPISTATEETAVNTSTFPTTSSSSLPAFYQSSLTSLSTTPRSHVASRQPLSLKSEAYKTSETVSTTVPSTTTASTANFLTESTVNPSINITVDATNAPAVNTTEFTPLLPEHAVLANRLSAKAINDAVQLQKVAQLLKINQFRARAAQRVLPALRRYRVHGLPTLRQSSVAKRLPPKFSSGENERVGIFNEPEAVDPDSVPALMLQQQRESHAMPKTLNFTRLRLFAARPNFAQSKLDRIQTAKNLQALLSKGKFHPLGRKVLSELPTTTSTTPFTFTPEVVQPKMLSTLPPPSNTGSTASQTKMIHSASFPVSTFQRLHGIKLSGFNRESSSLTSLNSASVPLKPMDEKLLAEQQHESGYPSDFTASTISPQQSYYWKKEETITAMPHTTISELKSVFEQTADIEKIENGEAMSENNDEWSSTTAQRQSSPFEQSETDVTPLYRFVPTAKPFYTDEEAIVNSNSVPVLNIGDENSQHADIGQNDALPASPFEIGDADAHALTTSSPSVFEHRTVSPIREWPSVQSLGYPSNYQSTSTTTEFPIIGEEESANLHDGAAIFNDKMIPVVDSDTEDHGGEITTILPSTSAIIVESSFVTENTEAPTEEGTHLFNDIRRHPQLSEQGSESATTVVDLPFTSEISQQQLAMEVITMVPETSLIDSDAFSTGSEVFTPPQPSFDTSHMASSTVSVSESQQQQQQKHRLQSDVHDNSVKTPSNKNSDLHGRQQFRSNMDTLAAIMIRKQRLQRIHQSSRSGFVSMSTNGDAASGYRNKVLLARRKIISSQVTSIPQLPLDGNKANSSGEFVLVTPGYVAGPGNEIERTTIISPLQSNGLSDSDVRRAPSSRLFTLPPPPHLLKQLSSVDESEKPADTEEMLIAKRTLVLNLEKFLRMRKEEIRAKTEGNFEAQRLTLLRRPKTEFESKQQVSGYCELYSTCIDQMKFVQRRCAEEHKELGGGDGRLLPGLPKRRFGACNTKLLLHYQRVDAVRSDLEESVETCLIDKIATKSAEVLASCPAEWPLLPAFETEFTTCSQKVVTIQNHCKKLGRCCTSLNKCRKTVESFALARRLRLEEERLNRRAAECQLSAHEEYKQLRQEIQDRQAAQIDSTLLSETATASDSGDAEVTGARAARKRETLYSHQPTTQFSASESAGSGFFALQPSDLRNSRFLM